jgi:hypothetical protein
MLIKLKAGQSIKKSTILADDVPEAFADAFDIKTRTNKWARKLSTEKKR